MVILFYKKEACRVTYDKSQYVVVQNISSATMRVLVLTA